MDDVQVGFTLACTSGKQLYLERYQQLWQYAWVYFAGEEHTAWYRLLDQGNVRKEAIRSSAGKVRTLQGSALL